MNSVQKIVKNIGVTAISQIFLSIIGFIFLIYLARQLGEADFGLYNFFLALTSLFAIFTNLGLNQYLVREIARKKEISESYTNNAFLLKLFLSIVNLILIIILTYILNYHGEIALLLYLFGLYNIFHSLSLTYLSLFQAWEKMEYVALFTVIERSIIVFLGFLVLFIGYGILEIAYIYLIAAIFILLFNMIISFRKLIKLRFNINLRLQKNMIFESFPFALDSLFAIFFFKVDTIILGLFIGDVAVGIYTAAYNPLLSLSMIIAGVVSTSVYPLMSRQFKDSKHVLAQSTLIFCKYLAIIGFPIALGCLILANNFIFLFYAGNYMDSVLPFQILAISIPIRMISSITGTLLSSINRQIPRTFSFSLAALFNLILCLILIPLFSYIGASIATIFSEIFLYFIFLFFINRYYGFINVNKVALKPFFASLIMVGFIYFILDMNMIFIIASSAAIYFISLIVLKTFGEEDKELFRNIIRKKEL